MIQNRVKLINAMAREGKPNARTLAVAIESNQLFIEYLDELLDNVSVDTSVTVQVDGQKIKFCSIEDVSEWIVNK